MEGELQSKYQKLVQEYQKLRSQVVVLKKAVIDEQTVAITQQESVKQKDQIIRKLEQETDSLQFRNEQLSRRVEILQGELGSAERKLPNKVSNTSESHSDRLSNEVAQQELLVKIQENEMLHKQLHEAGEQNIVVVNHLEEKIEAMEREIYNHNRIMEDNTSKFQRVINRHQEDCAILDAKLQKSQEDLKVANIMADKYHKQLKGVHHDVQSKLESERSSIDDESQSVFHIEIQYVANQVIVQKMPFNDTHIRELNILNLPVCNRRHQIDSKACMNSFVQHFSQMVLSLSDFLTYYEQRLKLFYSETQHSSLSATNCKLSTYLLNNATVLRKTIQTAEQLNENLSSCPNMSLDNCVGLDEFSETFTSMVRYFEKLRPFLKLSCGEECTLMSTSDAMESLTKACQNQLDIIIRCLQRISKALEVISHKDIGLYSTSAKLPCFKLLAKAMKSMHQSCAGLRLEFTNKMNLERESPSVTEHLTNTNDCIVTSLAALEKSTGQFNDFFDNSMSFLMTQSRFKRRGISDQLSQGFSMANVDLQCRASEFLTQFKMANPSATVPYTTAVQNHRIITSSTASRDSLVHQISVAQDSLSKLEQEKEQWMLEVQLIQAKLKKETQKVNELEHELMSVKIEPRQKWICTTSPQKDEDTSGSDSSLSNKKSGSISRSSVAKAKIGHLEFVEKEKQNQLSEDHDRLIKEHFTTRITELTKQLQKTDSKGATFHAECRALYKQLVLADRNMKKCEHELGISHQKGEKLQDELETVRRSYEDQLQMMSDHLCVMNEKLTTQTDEIDLLKSSSNSSKGKSSKKKS